MNNAVLCSKKRCCPVLYSHCHSVGLNNDDDDEPIMEYKLNGISEGS